MRKVTGLPDFSQYQWVLAVEALLIIPNIFPYAK